MESLLNELINRLTEFREHTREMGDVVAALSRAKAELATTNELLALAQAELIHAESGLSAVHIQNSAAYEETIRERTQELRSLLAKVATTKDQLDTLLAECASASTRHDQIEASIASLRKLL